MAADAGGGHRPRLRLSRRRRLTSEDRPSSGRPWFLQETGSGNTEPWAELLRTLRPDVDLADTPPPLPSFPHQDPQQSPEHMVPSEIFTVGGKVFSWTPFPPAPQHSRSYCLNRGAEGCPGSPVRPPFQCSEPEPQGTSSTKEPQSVEEKPPSVEETPTLRCCPMCQVEFQPGLSQLDIDGHLAQCLAESTDDIMWRKPAGEELCRAIVQITLMYLQLCRHHHQSPREQLQRTRATA
ncbi:PREDICTED: Fanconi anemia-associated protein of 20 kDa-like [Chrysochloris asiatica]|uniref:Fanconi anemia-associated protein of 20 kDa-like n=1 Tax=Chrysochloris asiatica TaxID=185453 RepID=A0A9B0U1P6_CHRAS|nr:PREDICTED: Fanconi anemia-associated protein of 20 kDa-like [Chrysochloris asiatica]